MLLLDSWSFAFGLLWEFLDSRLASLCDKENFLLLLFWASGEMRCIEANAKKERKKETEQEGGQKLSWN